MKTIYHVDCLENDYFFDTDGKCLGGWHQNDAMYRHEYMDPLFKKLGITVESIKASNPLISEYILNDLQVKGGYNEDYIKKYGGLLDE